MYTNYCDPSPDCYCEQQYTHGYGRFDLAWDLGLSSYLDPLNTGIDGIDGISISGISITHDPFNDMPFDDPSIITGIGESIGSLNFVANVTATAIGPFIIVNDAPLNKPLIKPSFCNILENVWNNCGAGFLWSCDITCILRLTT